MTIPTSHPVKPAVAIYNCGGTGMNIGALFNKHLEGNADLKNAVTQYFVDTSGANRTDFHTEDNTFMIGTKGSGKVRGENYPAIKEALPKIMHRFQPGVFNIIVCGASGGSGQTIQTVIGSHMLKSDIPASFVTVGSLDSVKEIDNLIRAFQSYQSMAQTTGKPVCVHYRENNVKTPRGEVDSRIVRNLARMSLLFAMIADKIDENDLRGLLNYPKANLPFPATVAGFDVFNENIDLDTNETLFAVATLATADVVTTVTPPPPLQHVGFLNEEIANEFDVKLMHWAVMGGTFDGLINRANSLLADFKSAASAYTSGTYLNSDVTVASDDGFVP